MGVRGGAQRGRTAATTPTAPRGFAPARTLPAGTGTGAGWRQAGRWSPLAVQRGWTGWGWPDGWTGREGGRGGGRALEAVTVGTGRNRHRHTRRGGGGDPELQGLGAGGRPRRRPPGARLSGRLIDGRQQAPAGGRATSAPTMSHVRTLPLGAALGPRARHRPLHERHRPQQRPGPGGTLSRPARADARRAPHPPLLTTGRYTSGTTAGAARTGHLICPCALPAATPAPRPAAAARNRAVPQTPGARRCSPGTTSPTADCRSLPRRHHTRQRPGPAVPSDARHAPMRGGHLISPY